MERPERETQPPLAGLGTFAGVFTPSVLTIIGIILFLRLGYVVGSGGLLQALLIIGLANLISVLTSISISAIATNLKVKSGGDYYLISRTLGLEYGGAIGLVLFFAQSISVGFYCIGFGEVAAALAGAAAGPGPQLFAGGAVLSLFVLAWLGADVVTRFQYAVMLATIAALVSFATGAFERWDPVLLSAAWSAPDTGVSFWLLFAIFFPAVTGFTQGVSMSGDLADPARSIPTGTFAAVAVSAVVYLACAVLFAGSLPIPQLSLDTGAMRTVSAWGWLIDVGVITSTLSSALASFMGAPRILQALAADQVIPRMGVFARGHGPRNEPRAGILAALVVALLVVGIGNLNAIAGIVSMFFLVSYGLINYATWFEASARSPSFRPTFRFFDHRLSLVGATVCTGAMIAIDLQAAAIALAVMFGLYQYLRTRRDVVRWADSRRSRYLKNARDNLLAAAEAEEHARDWRPQILAFSDDAERRAGLLRFARWIEGGSGLTTVVRLVRGSGRELIRMRAQMESELAAHLKELGVVAFPLIVGSDDPAGTLPVIVQARGVGPLGVNTVLVNHHDDRSRFLQTLESQRFGEHLRVALRFGCNLVVLDAKEPEWQQLDARPQQQRRIDIWWREGATGHLCLLLAFLATRDNDWDDVTIRVLPTATVNIDDKVAALRELLEEVRIGAEIHVPEAPDTASLARASRDASLVFVPLSLRGGRISILGESDTEEILAALPITAMCLAAGSVDLVADPDSGPAAQRGAARDRLRAAASRLAKLTEAQRTAEAAVRKVEEELAALGQDDTDAIEALRAALKLRQTDAGEATRKLLRAAHAHDSARAEAEAIGAIEPVGDPEDD